MRGMKGLVMTSHKCVGCDSVCLLGRLGDASSVCVLGRLGDAASRASRVCGVSLYFGDDDPEVLPHYLRG
jgi:hypothetical protein